MKAKELMCDDIVSYKGNLYKVSGTMRDADGLQLHPIHLRNSEGLILGPMSCFARDVEPVILTPEFFEKNGFSIHGDFVDSIDGMELVWREKGRLDWTINADEYVIMSFRHVHELQHALRLCGLNEIADSIQA